ncbi:hypothetical protein CHS0354_003518 [Potamilus streckersoni]|uniref:Uncharacterized protein n=1 Tax=Potamilus streckersoni TaxID=2493646 RepID=A0AAE0VHG3_9BIVA|nr:hypothetical protein CHS0354_003518 [Potamilus streckersoni]
MKIPMYQTLNSVLLLKAFTTLGWMIRLMDISAGIASTIPTTVIEDTTTYAFQWETTENLSSTNSTTFTLSLGNAAQTSSDTSVVTATTSTTISNNNISLACYDCSESFNLEWTPYTDCQAYPKTVSLRECLNEEKYCTVERTSYRERTISISRRCTDTCWYGCHPSDFGLTKLTCISCCQTYACNTDNSGHIHAPDLKIQIIFILFGFLSVKISNYIIVDYDNRSAVIFIKM